MAEALSALTTALRSLLVSEPKWATQFILTLRLLRHRLSYPWLDRLGPPMRCKPYFKEMSTIVLHFCQPPARTKHRLWVRSNSMSSRRLMMRRPFQGLLWIDLQHLVKI